MRKQARQKTATDSSAVPGPMDRGSAFEKSMSAAARHRSGAHYTLEEDIQRVIQPTLIRPLRKRLEKAESLDDLLALRKQIHGLRILDPACGSGNFLYMAFSELARLELELMARIQKEYGQAAQAGADGQDLVDIHQFYGIDIDKEVLELARAALMEARVKARKEAGLPVGADTESLNARLQKNIVQGDALLCDWPKADIVIGNPPFHSKNKAQSELGAEYVRRVRKRWRGVSGRADLCVYWFRRAHDELPAGGRAGLVGTNTIRQNDSRKGGLDYIVAHGGTITDAVSSQVWSGDADVHVSIVNWVKGKSAGKKVIEEQLEGGKWKRWEVNRIPPSLSVDIDVSGAKTLKVNLNAKNCHQGQTPGHDGFLVSPAQAALWLSKSPGNRDVLFPYLSGKDLLKHSGALPLRYIIDFHPRDLAAAQRFPELLDHVKKTVLPLREASAAEERIRNKEILSQDPKAVVNHHHRQFLKNWWLLSYPREELISRLEGYNRCIACSRITKRPIFEFMSARVRPSDALIVFVLSDDYSFGILQSSFHWAWMKARCSTLKGDYRYTSNTVYDSFVWPQSPTLAQAEAVAARGVELRSLRRKLMREQGIGLRKLYASLDRFGKDALSAAQRALDEAVRAAYGVDAGEDKLAFLFGENKRVWALEREGKSVTGPGLPPCVRNTSVFVTGDCVKPVDM